MSKASELRKRLKNGGVLLPENYINDYTKEVGEYFDNSQYEYGKFNYDNYGSVYSNKKTKDKELKNKGGAIRKYLNTYGSKVDAKAKQEVFDYIDNHVKNSNDVLADFKKQNDFYAQFPKKSDYYKTMLLFTGDDDHSQITRKNLYKELSDRKTELETKGSLTDTEKSELKELQEISNAYTRSESFFVDKYDADYRRANEKSTEDVVDKNRLTREKLASLTAEDLYHPPKISSGWSEAVYQNKSNPLFSSFGNVDNPYEKFYFPEFKSFDDTLDKLGVYSRIKDTPVKPTFNTAVYQSPEYFYYLDAKNTGDYNNWDDLTQEEINTYNYIKKNRGQSAADQYLYDAQHTLNVRDYIKDTEQYEKWANEHPVMSNIASVPMGLLGGISSGFDMLTSGDDYDPYSNANDWSNAAQIIRSTTAENIDNATGDVNLFGFSFGDVYSSAMSALDSAAVSIPTYLLTKNPAVTSTVTGLTLSGGSAYSRAKELYDQNEPISTVKRGGAVAAAIEFATEFIGVDNLFKPKAVKTKMGALKEVLKQGAIEGSEEGISEIANTVYDVIDRGDKSDLMQSAQALMDAGYSKNQAIASVLTQNIYESAMGGFVAGVGSGTVGGITRYASYNDKAKNVGYSLQIGGQTEYVLNSAASLKELNPNLEARATKLLSVDYSKLSGNKRAMSVYSRDLGNLYLETAETASKPYIESIIESQGLPDGVKLEKAVNAVFKKGSGLELSLGEKKAFESVNGEEIIKQVNSASLADMMEVATLKFKPDTVSTSTGLNTDVVNDNSTLSENAFTSPGISEKTSNVTAYNKKTESEVVLNGFENIEKNKITFKTSNNNTVDSNDIVYNDETQGVVYEEIASLTVDDRPIDANTANLLLEEVNATDVTHAQYQINAIKEAFRRGTVFEPIDTMFDDQGHGMGGMSFDALKRINGYGSALAHKYASLDTKAREKALKSKKKSTKTAVTKKGKLTYKGGKDAVLKDANEMKRATVEILEKFADETGADIEIFASKPNEQGRYTGKNGTYDPRTGRMTLDINAGLNGEGKMLYTLSHEFVHEIKAMNPEGYIRLSKVLANEYLKNEKSIDIAVRNYQARLNLSYARAHEEWVADSMERVLVSAFDGNTKTLNKIKTKCKDIWNALKDFFLKFARVISEYYSNMTPDSEAGRFVAHLEQKTFSVIKEIYFEELTKALNMRKHFKGLNDIIAFLDSDGIDYSNTDLHKIKNTANNDGVRYSFAGRKAINSNHSLLQKAQSMIEEGVDSETVRKETGWFRGYDNKWRFEIDDSEMEFHFDGLNKNHDVLRFKELQNKYINADITDSEMNEMNTLKEALKGVNIKLKTISDRVVHNKLFKAYPQLKDIKLVFDTLDKDTKGKYSYQDKTITLNNKLIGDNEQIRKTIIHEMQHAIQDIEGFAAGASIEYWKKQRKEINDIIGGARANLDLWLDDIGYNEFVKKSMQEVVNKEKTLEQHWEECQSFKDNSKFAKQIANCEAEIAEYERQRKEITKGMNVVDQYFNTAGEIEARDTESRLNLSEKQKKNTRPDIDRTSVVFADDTSISFSKKFDEYPYDMQTVIKEFLASTDLMFVDFIEDARTETNKKRLEYMHYDFENNINGKALKMANDILGFDISKYRLTINGESVHHIDTRHGENGKQDQSMKNDLDKSRVAYVINNADFVQQAIDSSGKKAIDSQYRDKNNNPSKILLFAKKVNGTFCAILASPESKKQTLHIKSMYFAKKIEENQEFDAKSPELTSKTNLDTSSSDIISHSTEKSNRNSENSNIKKSERIIDDAVNHFGTTYSWQETGYLLTDGRRLDFSGRKFGSNARYRTIDHREILDGFSEEDQEQFESGYEAMVHFMQQGNIRIMPESDGINLSVLPTKAQETKLSEFIARAHGEVILDIDDERGNTVVSVEYPYGTKSSKILNDIKNYFENGTEPYISEMQAFRYQARPDFDDFIFDDFDGEVTDNDARLMTEYLRQGKTDIVNHLINQTRNIEIHDGKVRTLVNRLLRAYDLSMDSNKDVYVALMSLLESQNKSEVDENLDLLQGVLGKVVRESSYISESDRKFRDEINEFLKDYRKEYAVYLNDEQMSSLGFQGRTVKWLRNKLAGSVNIVREDADTKQKKTSFGYFMHTMAENFPEYFSMADVDAVDSWETFIDKMDRINNPTDIGVENAYGVSEDEFVSELSARMIADVVENKYNSKKNAYVADLVKKLRKDHNRRVREVRERVRQKVKEAEQKKFDKLVEKHNEQRERYKEGRNKTAIKGKIRNAFKNIDSYLNHGNKKKNIKEGMRDFASKALELADIIFENNISNEDIIRHGVVGMSEREQKYYDLYQKQLQLRDIKEEKYEKIRNTATLQTIQQARGEISDINNKLKYYDQQLKDMFAREKAKVYEMPVQDAINALADAYSELRDSKYSYVSDAFDEDVLNMITELKDSIGKGTRVKDMTVDQLNEVYKAATAVLTTIRNVNKLFGSNSTVVETSEKTLQELDKVKMTKEEQSLLSKTLGEYGFNSLKPIYAMRLLGSKTFENLFWNLQKGETKWYQNLEKVKNFRDEIAKRYDYKSWNFKKMYSFTDVNGKSFEINLEQLMSIYALSQRPQGREHLLRDGFVSDEIKISGDKKKGYKISYKNGGVAHSMDVDILAKMSGELTDEQRAYVKEMQKFLSSDIAELGNEVSMSLYGIRQFEEPVYFPIKVAKDFLPTDYSNKNADAVMKNRGFTHKTVKNAGQPLILGEFSTTWANHCDEMAQYNALVLPLEDISKVLNYRTSSLMSGGPANSLKQQISGKWGKAALDYIETLIRDINGGVRVSGVKFADKLISLSKKASVFASISVVVQQPFAVARAMAYVKPKYFVKSSLNSFNFAKHNKDWSELKKYAPVAGIKEMGYFDTGIGRQTTDWILQDEYKGIKEKALAMVTDGNYRDEVLSKAPAVADELAWVSLWHAVKAEIKDTTELTGEELLQRCGERFNEVVQLTQVYDSVFSRSGFMRNKDTFSKMATAFMAEPTVTLNMNVDALVQGKRIGGKKGFGKASTIIGAVIVSQVLTALAKSAWTAGRDDDENKTYSEKFSDAAIYEIFSNLNPLNQMVLVRDVVSLVQGYDVKRMDMNVFAEIVKSTEKLAEAISDEEKEVTSDLILNAIGSYSNMFGLPVRNVVRDVKTALNLAGVSSGSEETSAKSLYNLYLEGKKDEFKSSVNALVKEKYDKYYAEGETEEDATKLANQSVRAYLTREYKGLYLEHFFSGNKQEASMIKSMLYDTGLYGTTDELSKTLSKWKEDYQIEQQKKKRAEERAK